MKNSTGRLYSCSIEANGEVLEVRCPTQVGYNLWPESEVACWSWGVKQAAPAPKALSSVISSTCHLRISGEQWS